MKIDNLPKAGAIKTDRTPVIARRRFAHLALRSLCSLSLAVCSLSTSVNASEYYWGGATPEDGLSYTSGIWSSSNPSWWVKDGTAFKGWNAGNEVLFGSAGVNGKTYAPPGNTTFTVTLGENITANWLRLHYTYTGKGLTISGGAENYVLTVNSILNDSAAPLTMDVVIAGTGGLEKAFQGTVIFTKNNAYSGGTRIAGNDNGGGGILQIGNGGSTGSLGSGTVTMLAKDSQNSSYSTLQFFRSDDITVSNAFTFSNEGANKSLKGGRVMNTAAGGKVSLSGAQTFQSGATGVYDVAARTTSTGPDMTISGALTGAGAIVKQGSGVLEVTSTSTTHSGTTTVNVGTLLINGATSGQGAYTINNGGNLGGGGKIGTANADITLKSGARISPGDRGENHRLTLALGTGSLDVRDAVSGANSGAFVFRLGSTLTSDHLRIDSGTLLIGTGVLDFNDFSFTAGAGFGEGVYTLISTTSEDAIIGALGSNLSGMINGYNAVLSLSGGDLSLTVTSIPEASTSATVLCMVVAGLGLRRFRLFC